MTAPRGIRNNNPGNIRKGIAWRGLASRSEMTPVQREEDEFCVFMAPEWGIRAVVRILHTYKRKYGICTVRGVLYRWAPPSDGNDTDAYVERVVREGGFPPDQYIDLQKQDILLRLIVPMIAHENGQQPYDLGLIRMGIAMAYSDVVPMKPVGQSKRVAGSLLTAAVTAGATYVGNNVGIEPSTVLGIALFVFMLFVLVTVAIDYGRETEDVER